MKALSAPADGQEQQEQIVLGSGLASEPFHDLVRTVTLACRLAGLFGSIWFERLAHPHTASSFGPRLRHFLETSGVTAIKIGQYLAIRIDLLPEDVTNELSRLFDAVPALPFSRVKSVIEAELGAPLATLFARFDEQPIGAASIAQVHRAVDHAGRSLAVKVQRPGVAENLRSDFRNLRRLAWLYDRFARPGSVSVVTLIDEVANFTLREVDFQREGRTADRIRSDAGPGVHIPRIYWNLTTPRVLAMEFIRGTPLARIINRAESGEPEAFERAAPGGDPAAIVETLSRACLRQLFITGIFQGDPHPANVLIEPDGTVALVDFGIFGELTREDRHLLRRYVLTLAWGRLEEAFDSYSLLVEPTAATDLRAYRRDTLYIIAAWYRSVTDPYLPPRERVTARFQGEMFQVMRKHNVRMRQDLILFWRALAVLDSTAQRVPVGFNLLASIRRFFAEQAPGPADFARQHSFKPEQVQTLVTLQFNAIRAAAQETDRRWRVEKMLSPHLRRHENAAVKAVALAAAGVGVAVAGGPTEGLLTVFCVIVSLTCLIAAAQQAVSCRRT